RHHDVHLVRQEQQLGTGHAVQTAQQAIPEGDGVVMILCGDTPLISAESLREMYRYHLANRSVLTVMTTIVDDPTGYGRILSAGDSVLAIVEEKETDELQRKIQEINAGIYLVERRFLFEALASLTPDNSQGEFYLTDIVAYAVSQKLQPFKYLNPAADEVLGVNSKVELETAHRVLQQRRNQELMQQGVIIHDRATVTVSPQAEIGSDTLLLPGVFISGKTIVGSNCILENGAILHDCTVGDNARIGAYCVLKNCKIGNDDSLPPMTLRG
ncbi:MAG: sugar phosphate nucleotidyltransferase, partial [Desulfopila sp.]|nr:sugar phosphate nucleotidyltransferase [Desulfopila sp.]